MISTTRPVHRTALRFAPFSSLLVVLLLLPPGGARAQDPFATEESKPGKPAPRGGVKPDEGTRGEDHQSLPRPKTAEPEEPPPVGPVERLPPTAYPEWRTRGLHGSSLWLTFHGMPWPYYPKTGIGISGYGWLDTGYEEIARGTIAMNEPHQEKYVLQQGRAALRVTPTYSSGKWFVQTQIELIANKNQTDRQPDVADVDDLWVRAGAWKSWDFTIGRFEGFEVYHFGMGLDINTLERQGARDVRSPPDVHGVNFGFIRPSDNVGNVAFHTYLGNTLRVELMGIVGNGTGLNTIGGRPAIVVDFGWLKLKAAAETRRQTPITDTQFDKRITRGATGAIQFVFDPYIEFGLNVDYGYIDRWSSNRTDPTQTMGDYDRTGSTTTVSFGGFANARIMQDTLFGIGANYNTQHDVLPDATTMEFGQFSHLQAFAALQYIVLKQLFIKAVFGYARAHFEPSSATAGQPITPWDNSMVSGRIRFLYLF